MKSNWTGCVNATACVLAALALAACTDRNDDASRQRPDPAVAQTEKAIAAAGNKAAELAELARDKTRAFVTSPEVRSDAAAVGNAIKNAGTAAAATADDVAITLSVNKALAADEELNADRIQVDTRKGVVHLTGRAPSAAAKARAGDLAARVQGVTSVDNALEIKAL